MALQQILPPIPADANKYTRGKLLVIAGSSYYPGAAILAAKAAARTGAGYVNLAIPEEAAAVAQSHLITIPVIAVQSSQGVFVPGSFAGIRVAVKEVDAIVLGPGIVNTAVSAGFVKLVIKEATVPMVLDADALNAIATEARLYEMLGERHILTPHAGELARLTAAVGVGDAQELATKTGAVVVEKGPTTHIFSTAKKSSSDKGTAALAKAGTGDVLAGIIGALLAQGMEPFEAAVAGVEIHSSAGCLAEQRYGRRSVIAQDVVDSISEVLRGT